jgi:hypothetical protein
VTVTLNQAGFRRSHAIVNATDYGAVDYLIRSDGLVAMRGRKPGQARNAPWVVMSRKVAAAIIRLSYRSPHGADIHERWVRDNDVSHPFWRSGFRATSQVELPLK